MQKDEEYELVAKSRRFFDGEGGGEAGEGGGSGEGGGAGGDAAGAAGGGGDGKGGAASVAFRVDQLPEELRSHETLAKFSAEDGTLRVSDMAAAHVSLSKMLGNKDPSKYVEMPGVDDAAGRRGVLDRLGAPKTVEDVKFNVPDGTLEFLKPQGKLGKGFAEVSQKAGLLPEQTQALYDWFTGALGNQHNLQIAEGEKKVDGWVNSLKAEFGQAFDQKVAAANWAIDKIGGESAGELRTAFKEAGMGAFPPLIKALSRVGEILAEDTAGEGGSPFQVQDTPNQLKAKAMDLQRQAMNETNSAERRRLNEEAQKLRALAAKGA